MNDALELLSEVKSLAKRYFDATGRPLGVTGEVAEFEAVQLLGLKLAPVRQSGWDASEPASERRYQVKGRVIRDGSRGGQRVGSLSASKEWDAVLLVLLNEDFEAVQIWEADRPAVLALLQRPGSRARSERGQLGVTQLIKVSKIRWSRIPARSSRSRSSTSAVRTSDGAMRYSYSRLCFKADVIEPLDDGEMFEVETPSGVFRMSKGQFVAEFGRVRETKSYREGRVYHFPTVPQRARKFLVLK